MYGQPRTGNLYYLRILDLMYLTIFVKMHEKKFEKDLVIKKVVYLRHNSKSTLTRDLVQKVT